MPRRAIAVAIVALLGLAAVAGCSSGKPNFGSATQGMFLRSCDPTASGGNREQVCRCAYDEVTKHYTYDSFSSLDADMKADPGRKLPDDLMQIIATCAITVDLGRSSGGSSSSSSSSSSSGSSSTSSSSSSSASSSSR